MDSQVSESLEKLRRLFDHAPFPRIPLEESPKTNDNLLYKHNLITPYYLKYQRVIDTTNTVILDAGCGSGFNALTLAEANPGATIIGIDISDASIQLARERLKYHGFDSAEFHVLAIEDLPTLGLEFDYINCDETLYLVPDPLGALNVMRSLLKPQGILRLNLHSALQRRNFYRGQALFKLMGLMEDSTDDAIEGVIETMSALKDDVRLKTTTWKGEWAKPDNHGQILANHLLVGDKGFTIPDLFALLEAADLEFLSMVNWRHWDVTDLFQDPDNLPAIWAMSLEGASIAERLRLYELLHPVSRLLDCWCTLPDADGDQRPVDEWTDADWQAAVIHLHPQLRHDHAKTELITSIVNTKPFEISKFVDLPTLAPVLLQSHQAACLLPLWESPQSLMTLVDRFLQVQTRDPITLDPTSTEVAIAEVKRLLNQLHPFLYVLLEQPHHG
ncbi:class I SAM-dependent methyltransferase [Oscillatoria sp. FACHB-1407]|uniref:class I SAM-dependent methyltransferase n=1 Tax=Oscillatoria sp. FACHB-1407 TaxID=2692847 RepID=UPI001683A7B3|nr:class I SAM-dependent methyltransferase [Oscillatoria sp. FACHB-1407]MBD2464961.1 class I SAM-dependent methyltransferase [Oscillatoria sp. FACHB-1407]